MIVMKRYLFSILLFIIAVFSLTTDWYGYLIFAISAILIIWMIQKLGNGILLRESIAFFYVFTCLIMPWIGYDFYTIENHLSRIWVGYMLVPKAEYYAFNLPAITIFSLAITWPLANGADSGGGIRQAIQKTRDILANNYRYGIIILCIGFVVSIITPFLPAGLQFFSNLFYFASFAGFMYIYFCPKFRYKIPVILLFSISIFANALSLGMFTIVAYMGITLFSFFFLGSKTSFLKKILVFVSAVVFLIVLQNVKASYRKYVWKSNYTGNKALLFVNLFIDNLQKGDALIETNAFFPLYLRSNQGFNISLVMKRIPASKPYDGGNRLGTVFASAFVPRFLWPDKPEAGGKFNMEYYAGRIIRGWSTNVGPLGEAYGSFGIKGGIIYMALLGFFIRWVYLMIFKITRNIPLLICWLPVFFFQVISSAETDSLQIFNSVFKSVFFVWLLYIALPQWFGKAKKQTGKYAAKQVVAQASS